MHFAQAQNVLSITDNKGRTFILHERSRVKFKFRADRHVYKGNVYSINDTALNINGSPVKYSELEMIAFCSRVRGMEIATYAIVGGDALAIFGTLASGGNSGISIVYLALVGVYATPYFLGYTIYHSIHKRKFYLQDAINMEVYSERLKKVKRIERRPKEFDGKNIPSDNSDYFLDQ